MGMESYNVMILPENVSIIRDKEYWRLCGVSDISIDIIHDRLSKLCGRNNQYHEYVFNKCIDVKVYEDNMQFQGFELRGCLSYLKGGSEKCYDFYEIQDFVTDLALYQPQGGDYLINEQELVKKCKSILNHIIESGI